MSNRFVRKKKMAVRIFLAIIIVFYAKSGIAQDKTRLINNWEFIRQDLGGPWEAFRPQTKNGPETVPLWQPVTLPHCVNAEDAVDPDVNYYQGPAWYRTVLDIHNPFPGGRSFLNFEGAGQKTEVYVYTKKVGDHVGGYDEFNVDITEAIREFSQTEICRTQFKGKIPIAIRTDNSRDPEMIPSDLSDFNIYGGIYRYLNLVYTPPVSIDQLFAFTELDKTGRNGKLTIKARLYNPAKEEKFFLRLQLISPDGKIIHAEEKTVSTKEEGVLEEWLVSSPQLWSPDDPKLYTLIVSLDGHHNDIRKIGFRQFEFTDNGPFYLNGKRLLLKGTHRHEDHAGLGAAMTEDLMRREMIMIKEMGVNFIRLGHYQQSRIILDLCDSLGILAWEEIPWCRGGLGGDIYKEQARRMLTNMIEQHHNHPSIIIWGLGNENDWPGDFPEFDKEKIRAFMKELNDLSHRLDPSRKTAIRRCDFCSDIVDVYSPSIWMGWYRGIYSDYKQVSAEEAKKVKHFLHVEWGGDSHAGRHSEKQDQLMKSFMESGDWNSLPGDTSGIANAARLGKDGNWNETYICNLIDWHLKEQETMPWLTGTAQWAFKDFSTPLRPDNPVPYVNQKGVVERDLTKKEAYYVFQSYWATKPMAHIYGHSWPVRWGNEKEQKLIKVYSNCDNAELFVNGKSYGKRKRNSQYFPAAGLNWKVMLQKGSNDIKVVAQKGKQQVEDSIHFEYQVEQWGAPAKMIIEKISEDNDTALVKLSLLDDKNVLCLDAANRVRFGLTGDGKLVDNLGTPAGSRYVQMYNGRALIRVKLNKGHSVVSAASEGLPTVFLNL